MTIEDDIEKFRVWAIRLGCLPDTMPDEEALKSVFKSRQRDYFCNLMRSICPRQEVQEIRENILIHKLEKTKGRVVSVCERAFLPRAMQTYLKMQDQEKKRSDVTRDLSECKKEYETLAASIKTKNIQKINLTNKCDVLEAKAHILNFKSKSLDKHIQRENKNKTEIESTMPVVLTNENKSETNAYVAVQNALKVFEEYYNYSENNKNAQMLQEAKNELWSNMHKIFAKIPNFLIFNTIMRLKEEQLQHVMSLIKTSNDSHMATASYSREPLTIFEINLMKTKSNFLSFVAKYLSACQERKRLEEEFVKAYSKFEDKFLEKLKLFNADTECKQNEDILRNYIMQYYLLHFTRGENEYLAQKIELLKTEIEHSSKHLENHEVLLGSLKQVYGEINTSVNRLQYEIVQLSQIKDKIIYSKNISIDLNDLMATTNSKSNFIPNKFKFTNNNNLSLLGVDSFEMSNDNVFCSTKLDFESPLSPLNNKTLHCSFGGGDVTLVPQAQNTILTSHTMELSTFCEMPLEHLSCISKECAFYLSANPLVIESRELSSTIQLAPGVLLTPFGALQEVRNRILWADLIAQHSNDLKLNLDIILVDSQDFKQRAKQQHDRIIEILDKIDVCSQNTLRCLQRLTKIYDFLIENPLRHFIPSTKLFNNQSYADYEAELTMYVRMATTGNSIK